MPKQQQQQQQRQKKLSAQEQIQRLNARIQAETPARGSVPYGKDAVVAFRSLPISQATLQGLEEHAYSTMTAIQSGSIAHALAGRDILAAAKTGSGKTLAFLVPLLERLTREGWTSPADGLGALVLCPTRELAVQIYAVLKKIGKYHSFSLGLLMGGRHKHRKQMDKSDFVREQESLPTANILICTPGRLLQHLEQTPYFNVDGLQMLVLDEADRILDMGFRDQLVRILDYLPQGRQTLLFSATQTKDVKHLATLSMNHKTVEYVGVHDQDDATTPDKLKQAYVLVPVEHKLNCVYSFLKSNKHLHCKTICFLASCSQVRHAWDLFCRLRPGLSVLAIHGKLSQEKRLQVYDKFSNTPHSILFATDVASRGLDFPNVDWVLQVDAPEDADMYVHRVGRTARFRKQGQALMLLDPAEEASVRQWNLKAPLHKKSINPSKTMLVSQRAASLVAENPALNQLAKKAFLSYTRSLALLPKQIWGDLDIRKLNLEAYSSSLGLASMPDLGFLKNVTNREGLRETKNVNRKLQKLKEQIRLEKEKKRQSKKRRQAEGNEKETEDKEDDDLLVFKTRHEFSGGDPELEIKSEARKPKKIRIDGRSSIKFGDDGVVQDKLLQPGVKNDGSGDVADPGALQEANESYLDKVRRRLEETRDLDKEEERNRIRAKHKKKRMQEKEQLDSSSAKETDGAMLVQQDAHSSSSNTDDSSTSSSSSSDDDSDDEVDIAAQEDLALSLIRGSA